MNAPAALGAAGAGYPYYGGFDGYGYGYDFGYSAGAILVLFILLVIISRTLLV
nr:MULTISPECIES: sporulation protein YjcZ [unclassified Paenibacillus]